MEIGHPCVWTIKFQRIGNSEVGPWKKDGCTGVVVRPPFVAEFCFVSIIRSCAILRSSTIKLPWQLVIAT